jgi:phospholipase/carboxylesterase
MLGRIAAVWWLVTLSGCDGCAHEPTEPSTLATAPTATAPATPAEFEPPGADGFGRAGKLRYLERCLACPSNEAAVPMAVMIHGLGDAPRYDWFSGADAIDTPLRLILPQAPTPYYDGFAWFPFRARDNDPEQLARGIREAAQLLAQAIAVLREHRPTRGLPIVAGFSQGGMLSYALALHHPESVALSHPISGLLPEPLWPKEKRAGVRYPKIAALHGDADDLVPIEPARRLVTHLQTLGYEVELREHPGVGHTITAAMDAQTVELFNRAAREIAAEPRDSAR